MGHIIISPVPVLSRAVLVDQACVDPVYVQSSGSGGIRTHNLQLQYQRRELYIGLYTFPGESLKACHTLAITVNDRVTHGKIYFFLNAGD